MEKIGDIISYHKNSATNNLLFGEGLAISTFLINAVKNDTELYQYQDWRHPFQEEYNVMEKFDIHRIDRYQQQYDDIASQFQGEENLIAESDEYKNLVANIRNNTVERRWKYENFFIEKSDISNPEFNVDNDVLGVVEYEPSSFLDNDNKTTRYWSSDEMEMMQQEEGYTPKVSSDQAMGNLNSVEGSHGKAVNAYDVGDIEGMTNPDNIQPQSPKYHREIYHDGNTNTSGEEFHDISQKKQLIQNKQREIIDDKEHSDVITALVIGLAVGSISAIIELKRLSQEQSIWNKRKLARVGLSFVKGASIGAVPILVINTIDDPIRNLIDNTIIDAFNIDGVFLADSLIENITDSLGDFMVISTTIAAGKLIRSGINGSYTGLKEGATEFAYGMKRPLTDQAGFFMLDILLDSLTPIPDPTLNAIITSARIVYSLSKFGINLKHRKDLHNYKFDTLYEVGASVTLGYM